MLQALLLALYVLSWTAPLLGAPINIGVVSSITGSLTDWNDTVAGYQFYLSRLASKSPNGIPITDSKLNTYNFPVKLTLLDDKSDAALHSTLVAQLMAPGGSDVVLNANPSFAKAESQITSTAGKLNLHPVTSNADVFGAGLYGVFGITPPSSGFTAPLFQSYKVSQVLKVAIAYRSDNDELRALCLSAQLTARQNLITYIDLPYTAADNLMTLAATITASTIDALVGCMASAEAAAVYKQLDKMQKPLKSIYFTNGPNKPSWNAALGSISKYLTAPSLWSSSMTGISDTTFGAPQDFAVQFASWAGSGGNEPSDYTAAAAATLGIMYSAFITAFANCDLTNTMGNPQYLLYNTSGISCGDNQNDGMKRLVNTIQQFSATTFFGSIGFNKQGQNYAGVAGTVQVFSVTQDLKRVYAPALVAPISIAVKSLVIPQPNRYAPTCPPGTYKNPDDYLPCIPCPRGQFQEAAGQDHCEICAKNSYSNATGQVDCEACPLNTVTSERGSTNLTDCICQVGFFNPSAVGGVSCGVCPINSACAGGTQWPTPEYGWFAEAESPFTMYNCNPNLVCEGNFTCATGYAKRMCSYCDTANKYFMALSRCYHCPSNGMIILYMSLMMILFIFLNTGVTRSIETFIVLINFCQILSLINLFNANWPNTISNLMNFASILAFEPDCIQPQCLNSAWSFEHNLIFQLLMPLIILAFTLLWIGVTYGSYKIKMLLEGSADAQVDNSFASSFATVSRVQSRTGDASLFTNKAQQEGSKTIGRSSTGSLTGSLSKFINMSGWLVALQNFIAIPSNKGEMLEVIYDRMSIPLMFLNSSYMASLKYCLSAFYCHDFEGTKYMYYMSEELCYSPTHYRIMMMAIAGLLIYCVGLWALVIHVLMYLKRTRSFGDKIPLLMFGWCYDQFRIEYYWFEVVSMFHRTAMTIIMVFMLDYTDVQLLIGFLVTGIVLIIQVKTAAISDAKARTLDTIGDGLLLVIIVIGLMLDNTSILPAVTDGLNNTLMAIIVGYLAAAGLIIALEAFFMIWTSILMSKHNAVAKKWGHKIKRFKHMYKVFSPAFMIKWLTKASVQDWQEWHKLGLMLSDYVHPTSETSYLSNKKVGRFWRYLLANFPEILDYLATVSHEQREHFTSFIETMYMDFFDSAEEHTSQLHSIVNENYQAAFAQWLSQAEEKEVDFLKGVMKHAYEHVKGKQAGMDLQRAMARSINTKGMMSVPVESAAWQKDTPSILTTAPLTDLDADCDTFIDSAPVKKTTTVSERSNSTSPVHGPAAAELTTLPSEDAADIPDIPDPKSPKGARGQQHVRMQDVEAASGPEKSRFSSRPSPQKIQQEATGAREHQDSLDTNAGLSSLAAGVPTLETILSDLVQDFEAPAGTPGGSSTPNAVQRLSMVMEDLSDVSVQHSQKSSADADK